MAPSIGIMTTTIIQISLMFFLKLFFRISAKADTHKRMKKTIMSIDLILNIGGISLTYIVQHRKANSEMRNVLGKLG
jgi:hypothetical protein